MAVFTQYLIINIALFVIIAYLVIQCYKGIKEIKILKAIIAYLAIQCYKDIKETLKDDNETFED